MIIINHHKKISSSSSSAVPLSTSLSCGQVIKQSVKLTANLDCKTDGIIVGADGITIDLNGFTLSGPGEKSSKVGVMFADNDGVTVQGPGTIKNFQAGALFSGGEDNKISRVTFMKMKSQYLKQEQRTQQLKTI